MTYDIIVFSLVALTFGVTLTLVYMILNAVPDKISELQAGLGSFLLLMVVFVLSFITLSSTSIMQSSHHHDKAYIDRAQQAHNHGANRWMKTR